MSEAVVPNQLFVAGYSRSKVTNDTDVKDIFKKHGTIKEVAYKGAYAFVTFNTEIEAQEALKALNGSTYNGQKLKVDVVDNRKGRRAGPSDNDLCFKCSKGGHWARDCPNGGRSRSPRRRRYSDSRSRRHKRSRRSDSRSYSSQSYSSSRSRRRNRHRRHRRSRSRSPRRNDRRRSPSPRRGKSPRSDSHSSVSNKRRASRSSSKSRK